MAEEIKQETIKWDGTNHCLMVIFATEHGATLTFHHETGVTLHIHGLDLTVAMGDTLLATPSGVTVVPGGEA